MPASDTPDVVKQHQQENILREFLEVFIFFGSILFKVKVGTDENSRTTFINLINLS